MPQKPTPSVKPEQAFAVTARGDAELRRSKTELSARELEVMVLVDGKATVAQIARSARGRSESEVLETVGALLAADLIAPAAGGGLYGAIDPGDLFSVTSPLQLPRDQGADNPEVANGVTSLKDKGYYVRIARPVPPERQRKVKEGAKLTALVIEDDEHLLRLLRTYLRLDGFHVNTASTREEVVSSLRGASPDIVLLDVMLPDADGFDILGRMRQHPTLKDVPVVMLTAMATREAVLKGLYCGADGYVTKPFDVEVLMAAVKTVLEPAKPDPAAAPDKAGPAAPQ
jgi:CheY-like chemotaxis protein